MSSNDIYRNIPIIRYKNGAVESVTDPVITEGRLKIYLNETFYDEIPVTPRDLPDLVTGFLYGEGLIYPPDNPSINFEGDKCFIMLPAARQKLSGSDDLKKLKDYYPSKTPEDLFTLMDLFQKLPSVYHETGGAHMAAFAEERIIHWADDISRRNAVDKVLGKGFREGRDFGKGMILSSGRISSDMVLRMVRTGIPFIASISAPSDRAVELAVKYNITICAFVRGHRFNIYSGSQRLKLK